MDKIVDKSTVHQGHRQRLRRRFLDEGLEGFEDHQVLELLLFNVLPRQDTNALAHHLLKRFGSFSAALDADPADVATMAGMGETAAAFLSLIPSVTRRYLQDQSLRDKPSLNDPVKASDYVLGLTAGRTEEVFYVLCLDQRARLLFPALLTRGTVNAAHVHPRQVVEVALRHKASEIILAHNHPSGTSKPSMEDRHLTRILMNALIPIGVRLVDHLITADNQCFSMAREGVLGL
ncbi:MAG: DNA repair protein RadC [Magnetococcales bacterium]|nr:DNA repair protein RadC [Magnetococcales bacterium]MBF0439608.1 DNA repair protein RadC [Magnetococcales bacterium]